MPEIFNSLSFVALDLGQSPSQSGGEDSDGDYHGDGYADRYRGMNAVIFKQIVKQASDDRGCCVDLLAKDKRGGAAHDIAQSSASGAGGHSHKNAHKCVIRKSRSHSCLSTDNGKNTKSDSVENIEYDCGRGSVFLYATSDITDDKYNDGAYSGYCKEFITCEEDGRQGTEQNIADDTSAERGYNREKEDTEKVKLTLDRYKRAGNGKGRRSYKLGYVQKQFVQFHFSTYKRRSIRRAKRTFQARRW